MIRSGCRNLMFVSPSTLLKIRVSEFRRDRREAVFLFVVVGRLWNVRSLVAIELEADIRSGSIGGRSGRRYMRRRALEISYSCS
jgi:hypothetical protein